MQPSSTMSRREPAVLLAMTALRSCSPGSARRTGSPGCSKSRQYSLEHLLVWFSRQLPLTLLVCRLLFLHGLILMIGGHWTYAEVPLGFWRSERYVPRCCSRGGRIASWRRWRRRPRSRTRPEPDRTSSGRFGPDRHLATFPARLFQYLEDEAGEVNARDRPRGNLFRTHRHRGVGRPVIRQPRRA